MVVTIKIQLTINGKFYATGPWQRRRKALSKHPALEGQTIVHNNRLPLQCFVSSDASDAPGPWCVSSVSNGLLFCPSVCVRCTSSTWRTKSRTLPGSLAPSRRARNPGSSFAASTAGGSTSQHPNRHSLGSGELRMIKLFLGHPPLA